MPRGHELVGAERKRAQADWFRRLTAQIGEAVQERDRCARGERARIDARATELLKGLAQLGAP